MTATTVKRKPAAATFGPPPCPPGLAEPYVPYDYSLIDAIPGDPADYVLGFTQFDQDVLVLGWLGDAYKRVAEVSRDRDHWLHHPSPEGGICPDCDRPYRAAAPGMPCGHAHLGDDGDDARAQADAAAMLERWGADPTQTAELGVFDEADDDA